MQKKIETQTTVDARKSPLGRKEAVALARAAKELFSTSGSKVHHIDLTEPVSDDDLASAMLGPTGNLRAPTLRVGDTLIVGFNQDAYKQVFGRTLSSSTK